MNKVLDLQRPSLTKLLAELKEKGPKTHGILAIWFDDADEAGHFRISGFDGPRDIFLMCGLLDWIKADLLTDLVEDEETI